MRAVLIAGLVVLAAAVADAQTPATQDAKEARSSRPLAKSTGAQTAHEADKVQQAGVEAREKTDTAMTAAQTGLATGVLSGAPQVGAAQTGAAPEKAVPKKSKPRD